VRVALVHDWLTGMRGGERVLEELARMFPDADLFTLVHIPGTTSPALDARNVHASFLSRIPGIARHYRLWLPLFPTAVRRLDLSGYELVISCSHAVAKSVRVPPEARHLSYCLTPMRYVWDQRDAYLGRGPIRLLASPLVAYLRRFDRATSGPGRVHRFVAISRAVRDRIARHYGRRAEVVHPPVATDRIRPGERAAGDFYLLVGGFVPYKREDLALEAFRSLGRRLIVAGDGPARRRLEAKAPANVEFTGRIPDDELARLYAGCRALIHPQEEDFGIAAVEAQAAGRPVIAYGRGGAVDSVRPLPADRGDPASATGLFFDRQEPAALVAAVERFEQHEALFDPRRIRAWAEGFSPERFRAGLTAQIEAL
jgi:glycosyltransferase involved in cell wall biosynthesis